MATAEAGRRSPSTACRTSPWSSPPTQSLRRTRARRCGTVLCVWTGVCAASCGGRPCMPARHASPYLPSGMSSSARTVATRGLCWAPGMTKLARWSASICQKTKNRTPLWSKTGLSAWAVSSLHRQRSRALPASGSMPPSRPADWPWRGPSETTPLPRWVALPNQRSQCTSARRMTSSLSLEVTGCGSSFQVKKPAPSSMRT
mmetsp:Transcript_16145/g.47401  ORF Transcript_16145/g.47401 Transcript_16145/m.47401 type:complete len:202 (+) Transcript_16145:1363-1968(+)